MLVEKFLIFFVKQKNGLTELTMKLLHRKCYTARNSLKGKVLAGLLKEIVLLGMSNVYF